MEQKNLGSKKAAVFHYVSSYILRSKCIGGNYVAQSQLIACYLPAGRKNKIWGK